MFELLDSSFSVHYTGMLSSPSFSMLRFICRDISMQTNGFARPKSSSSMRRRRTWSLVRYGAIACFAGVITYERRCIVIVSLRLVIRPCAGCSVVARWMALLYDVIFAFTALRTYAV